MSTIVSEGDLEEPLLLLSRDEEVIPPPVLDEEEENEQLVGEGEDEEGTGVTAATASSSSPRPRHTNNNNNNKSIHASLVLLFVSFLFATLNVSLRYLYTMPHPATPPQVNMIRGWFTCLFFLPLVLARNRKGSTANGSNTTITTNTSLSLSTNRPLWMAAGELAIWNTLGQVFVNVGLLSTPSARASFLGQTVIVLVPLTCVAMGGRSTLRKQDILGCVFSMIGVVLLSTAASPGSSGGGGGDGSSNSDFLLSFHFGDLWILASAVCFSFYLIRVSHLAHHYDEIFLQGTKNTIMAFLYSLWFAGSVIQSSESESESGSSLSFPLWAKSSSSSWMVWSVIAYTAFGPGCLADVLQQRAQEIVPPTQSNLILCSSSVFTAILSRILLGEETSFLEKLGGAFLIAGAIVAGSSTLQFSSSRVS